MKKYLFIFVFASFILSLHSFYEITILSINAKNFDDTYQSDLDIDSKQKFMLDFIKHKPNNIIAEYVFYEKYNNILIDFYANNPIQDFDLRERMTKLLFDSIDKFNRIRSLYPSNKLQKAYLYAANGDDEWLNELEKNFKLVPFGNYDFMISRLIFSLYYWDELTPTLKQNVRHSLTFIRTVDLQWRKLRYEFRQEKNMPGNAKIIINSIDRNKKFINYKLITLSTDEYSSKEATSDTNIDIIEEEN